LIRHGYLSAFVAFAPSEPDLAGVRTMAGDFHEGELSDAMDKPSITGDIVETWLKRGEARPTLVYGVHRAHAEHLQQRFVETGIAAAYIDCDSARDERARIFARFRAGDIRVICNVATLSTGLDLPMVSCIVDARPTKSRIPFVQTIGRGLRTADGKDHLLILDHAGNHLRLGVVTDVGQDYLDDGKGRQGFNRREACAEPLPKLCEECKAVLPRQAKKWA
jgi:superfamily II DNA or RNA helicase